MIFVVTTAEHTYTHTCLEDERDHVDVHLVTWDTIFADGPIQRASYILTDFDRLAPWQLYKAAVFYQRARRQGLVVLNNPARFVSRPGLLRRLFKRKINIFNAYRVEEQLRPAQWPVFLRADGNHGDPLTGLIHDPQTLQVQIEQCIQQGCPRSALMIVEYAAEPVAPGLFRKLSVFRIGNRLIGYPCVHDDQWVVKHGKPGIAPLEFYEDEYRIVRDNPFGQAVYEAFLLSGLEYGRADFGLVRGRPQIYEINNNPDLKLRTAKPFPIARRNDTFALFADKYLEALAEIDTPPAP